MNITGKDVEKGWSKRQINNVKLKKKEKHFEKSGHAWQNAYSKG